VGVPLPGASRSQGVEREKGQRRGCPLSNKLPFWLERDVVEIVFPPIPAGKFFRRISGVLPLGDEVTIYAGVQRIDAE
jgi:hypothetical protein